MPAGCPCSPPQGPERSHRGGEDATTVYTQRSGFSYGPSTSLGFDSPQHLTLQEQGQLGGFSTAGCS